MKYKLNCGIPLLPFTEDFMHTPTNDNEWILKYQKEFRAGVKDSAKHLFFHLRNCARRFIYHERNMKGFFITGEDATEKATVAAEYIMEQYLTRPDFQLQIPSAYIRLRVLAVLYRHKKIDEVISYTDRDL